MTTGRKWPVERFRRVWLEHQLMKHLARGVAVVHPTVTDTQLVAMNKGGIRGLRCVADLSVRVLRIAQPVSHQLAEDPSRILARAAQALVAIIRDAGVDVVAPADTAGQAADWTRIGANWAIGALFGPPGPAQRIEPLLERAAIADPAQPTPNVRN